MYFYGNGNVCDDFFPMPLVFNFSVGLWTFIDDSAKSEQFDYVILCYYLEHLLGRTYIL